MKTLALDTSWKNLVVVLIEDGKVAASFCQNAFKKQSELMFVILKEQLEKAGWTLRDIDRIVITDGPGSYTGLRIAMTAAKIIASQTGASLYTVSLMQLYAGLDEDAHVILDARGNRVYYGHCKDGLLGRLEIIPVDAAKNLLERAALADAPFHLYGEGELAEMKEKVLESDFVENFVNLIPLARKVRDVDALVPFYMKDNDGYLIHPNGQQN